MARKPFLIFLISRLLLLFLICSSCAWAGSGATAPGLAPGRGSESKLFLRRGTRGGDTRVEQQSWRRIGKKTPEGLDRLTVREDDSVAENNDVPTLIAEPAHILPAGSPHPTITPPPSLVRLRARQDQGQIDALSAQLRQLSEQSRQVSQASQQLSQSSQQLSQSLQQMSQRLSQTEQSLASARLVASAAENASREMSQASAEASRRADEASRRADQAITEAQRSASQSASRAVSESLAALSSSLSSALSAASRSASEAMRSASSVARAAQAEATALRNEANTQIQAAQNTTLSVTQTALAVVGAIIGSSLLTGLAVIFVIRYRRNKQRELGGYGRNRGEAMGYPQFTGTPNNYEVSKRSSTSSSSVSSSILKKGYYAPNSETPRKKMRDDRSSMYSTEDEVNTFQFATGAAAAVSRPTPVATTGRVGYAVGSSRPGWQGGKKGGNNSNIEKKEFKLSDPPPPKAKTNNGAKGATAGTTTTTTGTTEAGGGRFSLFPSPQKDPGPAQGQAKTRASAALSSAGMPSLEKWLRDGTNVSPFATVKGLGNRKSVEDSNTIGKAR